MVNYFKKSRWFYYGLSILWILFLLLLAIKVSRSPLLSGPSVYVGFLLLALIGIVIFAAFANKIASGEMNQLIGILYQDCDPVQFVQEFAPVAAGHSRLNRFLEVNIQSIYAVGLLMGGWFDKAAGIGVLLETYIGKLKKPEQNAYLYLYLNWIFWEIGERDKALRYLNQAKEHLSRVNPSSRLYQGELQSIAMRECSVWVDQGEYNRALDFLAQHAGQNLRPAQLVYVMYRRAEIYHLTGNREKELECLHYIIDHGNRLYVVQVALRLLEQEQN
ncbi:hypothetical protein [Anaerolentibacter hominis]|uniref:hypothetical protein n=1 Tax=Anaerolentibacter hominis TaxID=3079009 RepID=UPI0031B88706